MTSPMTRITNCNAMPEGAWRLATWRACVLERGHEGAHRDEDGNEFVLRVPRYVTTGGGFTHNRARPR